MSTNPRFYIVDVFSEQRYAGNQLAVFRAQPPDAEMQKIAIEMNYAETTFITSETPRDGGYDVRIFTKPAEVPFAGHPTLGTAYIIRREIIGKPVDKVVLNLKVGQIPVTFAEDGFLWMKQKPPVFGHTYAAVAVADVLGLRMEDMDERFPVQEVSTGLPFLIVPLKSRDAVKRAYINATKFAGLKEGIRGLNPEGMFIFCTEPYNAENQLNTRALFPTASGTQEEDAATGSANGCLAGYLVHNHYFGSGGTISGAEGIDVRVEQGYEMGRPALLWLRASQQGDHIDVNVGGKVVMIARGEWVE